MEATLVIDVDVQDDWKDKVGSHALTQRKKVASAIRKEIDAIRKENGVICFVMMVVRGELKRFGPSVQIPDGRHEGKCCIVCDGDEKNRIVQFLDHRHESPNEPAFIKCDYDSFGNTALAPYLRSRGVTSVRLAGCYTSECVFKTALGALRNGFKVTLLSDCVYHLFANDEAEVEWLESLRSAVPEKMRENLPSEVLRESNDHFLLRIVGTR